MKFDKSDLPLELIEKQKQKGTYDSPCLSVCNYCETNLICQTCLMHKNEKIQWKQGNPIEKAQIVKKVLKRRASKKE